MNELIAKIKELKEAYPKMKIGERMPSKLETRLMISPQGDLYRMIGSEEDFIYYGNLLKDDIDIKDIYEKEHCN